MTPINETEAPTEVIPQLEQAASDTISARNVKDSLDLHEYFKSLPNSHAKPLTGPIPVPSHEIPPTKSDPVPPL